MTQPSLRHTLPLPADDTLVPFLTGISLLGIPRASAERRLRRAPQSLPPVHRLGWQRYFTRGDLEHFREHRLALEANLDIMRSVLDLARGRVTGTDIRTRSGDTRRIHPAPAA
jgi:hypothetical protein